MQNFVEVRTRYSYRPMYLRPIDLQYFAKRGPATRPQLVLLSFHCRVLDAIYHESVGDAPVETHEHDVDLTIIGVIDYSTFYKPETKLLKFISLYLRELEVFDERLHLSITRYVGDMIRQKKHPVSVTKEAVTLAVEINVVNEYIYDVVDEDTTLQSVLEESMRQVQHGMVPASKSALLKALKTERVIKRHYSCPKVDTKDQRGKKRKRDDDEEESECCPICMDEFPTTANVVTKMPCGHRFHGPCIVKWLKTSHFCPICRFEISTE